MPETQSAAANRGPAESTALNDLLALAPAADRARLAGIAATGPKMAARSTQLAREALRAQARFGADDPRSQALALKAEHQQVRNARLESELARAQVITPERDPAATVIWGRVSQDGRPVVNVTVSARGARGEVLAFGCTDAVGAFSMTVPGQATASLRVTDPNGGVLYAGTDQIEIAPGRAFYRDIEIGAAPIDLCRRPSDDTDQAPTVRVPDVVGRSEAEGVRMLAAVGLRPGERTEAPLAEKAGQILRQDPPANATVAPGSAVAIQVATTDRRTVPALVGEDLLSARAALARAGIAVASATVAVDEQRVGIVLRQAPEAGAQIDPKEGITLVVGRPRAAAPLSLVLALVALDPRFEPVRMGVEELMARARQLGLGDRLALAALASAADAIVRDAFALPALRDAQTLKRVLRDLLARTE